jgi:hypothetical protein
MRLAARIGLIASGVLLLGTPVLAQDRPAKDGDEIGASLNQIADRDYLARCLARPDQSEAAGLRAIALSRLPINLSAPERFWLLQRSHRTAAAKKPRCTS